MSTTKQKRLTGNPGAPGNAPGKDTLPTDPEALRAGTERLFCEFVQENGFATGRDFLAKHNLARLSVATPVQCENMLRELKKRVKK